MKQKITLPLNSPEGWAKFLELKPSEFTLISNFPSVGRVKEFHRFQDGATTPFFVQYENTPSHVFPSSVYEFRARHSIEFEEELKPLYAHVTFNWVEHNSSKWNNDATFVKYVDKNFNQVGEIELIKK
jgi:hypothetical protein